MSASLTVQYSTSEPANNLFGFALTATVTAAAGMSPAVFMYQRVPGLPNCDPIDNFICVADPVDLEELPVDQPDLTSEIPYYRAATVTLYFRSIIELNEAKSELEGDLRVLVLSVNAMASTAYATETQTYP